MAKRKPKPKNSGETAADAQAISQGENQQRIANLGAIGSSGNKSWTNLSPQEQAVAKDLANDLFGTRDLAKLSADQWSKITTVAQERYTTRSTAGQGDTTQQAEAALAANPFAKMGQALVGDQQNLLSAIEPYMSGAMGQQGAQSAENQALASLGIAPGSGASNWLSDQVSKANATDQPVEQALAAYGAAFGAGQGAVGQALGQMGSANALQTQTAPETEWLNALMQHVQTNLAYYGEIPTGAAASLPPSLLYYLQQAGAGQGSTGLEPLTAIKVPGQTGGAAATSAALSPLTNYGSQPGTTATPPALQPGTGSAPS